MELLDLPVTRKRMKGESKKCGKAVQAFNVPEISDSIPGWISGKFNWVIYITFFIVWGILRYSLLP